MKPSLLLLPALVASWSLTPDKTRGSLDPEDYALALAEGWFSSKDCDDLDSYGRVTNKECDSRGMDEEMRAKAGICDKSYFGGSDPNALSCDHSCDWPKWGEDKYTRACDGDCDLGCTHPCEAAKPWKKTETPNWSYKANSCDSSCDYGRSVWGWDETKEEWDQGRMGRKRKLQDHSMGCDESCDWGCHSAGELFQAAVNQIPEPIGKATGVLAQAVENLAKAGGCELSKKDLYEIIGDAVPSFAGMQTNLSLFKDLASAKDELARVACVYMWNGPFAKYKAGGQIVAGIVKRCKAFQAHLDNGGSSPAVTIGLEVSLQQTIGTFTREVGAEIGVGFGIPTPNGNSRFCYIGRCMSDKGVKFKFPPPFIHEVDGGITTEVTLWRNHSDVPGTIKYAYAGFELDAAKAAVEAGLTLFYNYVEEKDGEKLPDKDKYYDPRGLSLQAQVKKGATGLDMPSIGVELIKGECTTDPCVWDPPNGNLGKTNPNCDNSKPWGHEAHTLGLASNKTLNGEWKTGKRGRHYRVIYI